MRSEMRVARMKKYVPLVLPWFLPSAMFSVVMAAVHAWKTDSLLFAFLFVGVSAIGIMVETVAVRAPSGPMEEFLQTCDAPCFVLGQLVLPLAIWTLTIKSCSKEVHDPVFAPSFVAAVVFTDIVTFFIVLRPAISVGLEVAFVLGAVNLLVLYWRVIKSDPGRFPVHLESTAWTRGEARAVNSQLVSSPRLEGWTAEDYEGIMEQEPLEAKDSDIERVESHQAIEKLETNDVEAEGVVSVSNGYSLMRLPVRTRYCRKCNAWTDHFDHHCPAIKNCVGRKNHVLFLGALAAFIVGEVLYIRCCYKYIESLDLLSLAENTSSTTPVGLQGLEHFWLIVCQVMSAVPWVTTTALFAAFQVSWQMPLLLFHVYCASINLTTAEWIKWERYSDLYIELPLSPGRQFRTKKFVNPYDQGVLINLNQFFRSRV